jgi:mannan polymerase II complex MNN11 subunit
MTTRSKTSKLKMTGRWHGTLLAKLELVPQNVLASYTGADSKDATENGVYDEGDFIVSFGDCDSPNRNCREEMAPWLQKLHGISI